MTIRKAHGFTLIEVIVVVAIIAILAANAIPGFNDQIRKSRRADAQGKMEDIRLRLEKYRVDHPNYGMSFTSADWSDTFYTITLSGTGAAAYTITATPKNNQTNDKCGTMTLVNTAGVISQSPANCW